MQVRFHTNKLMTAQLRKRFVAVYNNYNTHVVSVSLVNVVKRNNTFMYVYTDPANVLFSNSISAI